MIRKFSALLAFASTVLLSATAAAQTATVRSGEHENFSRLVFSDSPNRTWAIFKQKEVTYIRFSAGVPHLDLSKVFDLIPRTRIREAYFEGQTLSLSLGCNCTVDVSQIATSHIVIDVVNTYPTPFSKIDPLPAKLSLDPVSLRLEPLEFPTPLLSSFFESQLSEERFEVSETTFSKSSQVGMAQVRRHAMGHVPILLEVPSQVSPPDPGARCEIDTLARMLLTAEPRHALMDLTHANASLLTGQDELDRNEVHRLALIYLRLGWGAEAAHIVAGSGDRRAAIVLTAAAALDGWPLQRYSQLDPGCGPGAAVIALLIGVEAENWARANEEEVVRLLDAMPVARWQQLGDRLSRSLAQLNRAELLVGIDPTKAEYGSKLQLTEIAAGTDTAAVLASIELLESANMASQPVDQLQLENARAIRPSIPNGPNRDALDRSLAEALVLSRRPTMAIEMVSDGQISAGTLFDLATNKLPPEDAADFIVRLEPFMGSQDDNRLRARDFFMRLGLRETARRFDDLPEERRPVEMPTPSGEADAWLSRDLNALVAEPPDAWSVRNEIADAILDRNQAALPSTDLAIAEQALKQSRDIGGLARRLLASP